MNTSSQEALKLAVKLSGHDGTQCKYGARICEGCVADARIIDETLQLPARNTALLLAQGAVETYQSANWYVEPTIMEQLREALSRIKAQ